MKLTYCDEGLELTIAGLPPIWFHGGIMIVAFFLTFPLWSRFSATGFIAAGLVAVGIILSILAHELGHSLTARYLGFTPTLIRLHAGGGQAILETEGSTHIQRRLITIAGPIINLVLGLVLLLAYHTAIQNFLSPVAPSPEAPWFRPPPTAVPPLFTALLWLGVLNLVWCGVNLLPAFPLDGGSLLYEALEARYGSYRALFWTGLLGTAFAIAAKIIFIIGILTGLVLWSPPYLKPNLQALRASRQHRPAT